MENAAKNAGKKKVKGVLKLRRAGKAGKTARHRAASLEKTSIIHGLSHNSAVIAIVYLHDRSVMTSSFLHRAQGAKLVVARIKARPVPENRRNHSRIGGERF
jgi:hypothetical protein